MQTAETLARVRAGAGLIAGNGFLTDVRAVSIGGVVGGRDHNPTMFWGHAIRYVNGGTGECIQFWPDGGIREALRLAYVIDGVPMYVAGWQGAGNGPFTSLEPWAGGYVILHPYDPTTQPNFMPHKAVFLRTAPIPVLKGEAY